VTGRKRRKLDVGSEEEVGRKLLNVLRDETSISADVVFAESDFWAYRNAKKDAARGRWVQVQDERLHKIVGSFDGAEFSDGRQARTLRVSDNFARGAIRRAAVHAAQPDFFAHAEPVLVFKNGAVRVTEAGEIEVLKHASKHRARVGYAFDYDRRAKCERFMAMQRDHFRGDADAEEKIFVEQEFYGACLFGMAPKFEKCLALPCDGGGGRSTKLKVIEAAFPAGLVCHLDARELKSAERRTRLVGKRLNFSDEVPSDAFLDSEEFKKAVTGNILTAEGKYRASFEFRPIAGFVFPIQVSGAAELTDAFWRRFIFNRYNRAFEGDPSRVLGLADQIIAEEIPGVVAWLVEGAARLLRQGRYTVPSSHFVEEAKWKLTADTARAFLDAVYTRSTFPEPRDKGYDHTGRPTGEKIVKHDWAKASALYSNYRNWCGENGHRKPVPTPEFSRRVEKIGYPCSHTHKGNFYGVRPLESAQSLANEEATKQGTPLKALKGAVSILQGSPKLSLVANSTT
jgi:phage/plasmid-associated DNA primase